MFKDKVKELDRFEVVEDIYFRRVKVVLIKLKYGKDENFGILEIVILKYDIFEIVWLCELNFKEMDSRGIILFKGVIDLEYKDWLNVICIDVFFDIYIIEDVMMCICRWYVLLRSFNLIFYLFIFLIVFGIGCVDNIVLNVEFLREVL